MSRLDELYSCERKRLLSLEVQGDVRNPVFGEGNERAALMLIGEAPGAEEAAAGRPFVGKAGRQLDEMLKSAGIVREDVFVTNAVKYRPVKKSARGFSNRTPVSGEVQNGLPLLKEEILYVHPQVIAVLGNTPIKAIYALAGDTALVIGDIHGKPLETRIENETFLLFPLYHPASSIYNRSLLEIQRRDLIELGKLMRKEVKP